ncbi:CopD family protein [Nitrosopumilus sp.]|uniref:copper resistance CopC/CopD family protein n=1 Tax=Nitrosopumilus sp. TaxID=2024843 RepID=UPI00292EBB35|nr:CopD family protein [Nitrosopumilus sp.]
MFPATAWAHPFTEDTIPENLSSQPAGLTSVITYYSEAIEIDFSELKVIDSNGNQIDNKDTQYHEGDYSLVVTTPPLDDGLYTVTSKVLSRVDGHLVDSAFTFGVGDVQIPIDTKQPDQELIFYPEAGVRFPGLVGQTVVLGAIISSVFVWSTLRKDLIQDELQKIQLSYRKRFLMLTGFGILTVTASNILMLAIQAWRLDVSPFEIFQTSFGSTWLIRMGITIVLGIIWVIIQKANLFSISIKNQIPLFVVSLALIGTTTMMGHGAASEQIPAITLDYVHNLVSSVWIGGIIFFAFVLLPVFSTLNEDKQEKMSLVLIPRFSIMIVISLGIVIISGPLLLGLLENDVGIIAESTYGKLIVVKVILAGAMVAIGGYHQFGTQKQAEINLNSGSTTVNASVHKRLQQTLKVETVLGIALLATVALLTNGTLPSGEIQTADAQENLPQGFAVTEFSETIRFDVKINPLSAGLNTVNIKPSDVLGNPLTDLNGLTIKVSNPQKNISSLDKIQLESIPQNNKEQLEEFEGSVTFGFSGTWQVEIEAQRTENPNESIILNPLIKPRLSSLDADITEYKLSEKAFPFYPVYDPRANALWISDNASPIIWKFSIDDKEISEYAFDGDQASGITIDNDQKVWFTDSSANKIGFLNQETGKITTTDLPDFEPFDLKSSPTSILADSDDNIWVTLLQKNVILQYNPDTNEFKEFVLPTDESGPFALALDQSGNIWFSESYVGKIGFIDSETFEIKEFQRMDKPLQSPESLIFDKSGNLWIGEHTGAALVKFNPVLEIFETVSVLDPESLPFGMTFDRYGNIWFAQHVTDNLGVYDPHNDDILEVQIPTNSSFTQFVTSDADGNVWFAENREGKIGMVKLVEMPSFTQSNTDISEELKQDGTFLTYSELMSPLVAGGIVATSLFFVKSVKDKRRIHSLVGLKN